jgi:deoxyribodipyrimidine photolyase-related protein
MKTLRLILGDQLSPDISALDGFDRATDRVLMMEVHEEGTYVPHHPKKIVFILSAMRHFAEELRAAGCEVDYVKLDSSRSRGSFTETLRHCASRQEFDRIVVTEPGEYRVLETVRGWTEDLDLPVEIREDDRFFASRGDFADWAEGRKQLLLENFYRMLRRRTGYLMDGRDPAGGRWNYDKDNRKPAGDDLSFPGPLRFEPDVTTRDVIRLVKKRFPDHFGEAEPFWFAVTRQQAEQAFEHFLERSLSRYGDYQDAMLDGEAFLFHSVISPYLNVGLLDPRRLCEAAEDAWRSGRAPLNAVEGFIRQILGWREFVRGVYWHFMPDYANHNFLEARRPLPAAYWGAETDLHCVSEVVRQTREEAYSHHIQRLMITGNFGLLAGVDPAALHEWYLAVYADAYEWVELPNTIGMATFADGGIVGTKPYASGGAYINKMSNFCGRCRYDVKKKAGEDACPFNYLYWNFLLTNHDRLQDNRRLALPLRQLTKFSQEKLDGIREDAARFLAGLDPARS